LLRALARRKLETLQTCPKQNDHARKPQVAWKTGSRTELVESENRESQKEKERVSKEKGAHRLGKQSLGIKMRIVEAILHPLPYVFKKE